MPNPLLDAYLKSVQVQHEQDQMEFERKQSEAMLKLHQKQLDDTEKQHQNDLAFRKILAKQAMTEHFNSLYGNNMNTNGLPTPSIQGTTPQQDPNDQGLTPLPTLPGNAPANSKSPYNAGSNEGYDPDMQSMFGNVKIDPQYQDKQNALALQQGAIDAANAGAKQGAIEEPKRVTNDRKLATEHTNKLMQIFTKGDIDEHLANIHAGASKYAADQGYAGRVAAANIHAAAAQKGLNIDTEDLQNMGETVLNGQEGLNTYSPKEKRLIQAYAHETGRVVPDPEVMKVIPNLVAVQDLLDRITSEGQKYSASDKPGSYAAGKARELIPSTDTNNFMRELKSQAGRLTTLFDQQNRKAMAEMMNQIQGTFDPGKTWKQNLENLQRKRRSFNSIIQGTFHGIPPEQLDKILVTNGIHQFGGFSSGNGGKLLNYTEGGKTFKVHPDNLEEFKQAHPNAKLEE